MKLKLGVSNGIKVGSFGVSKSSIAAAVTYSISGTVFDADGTTAVSGATVAIGSSNTTSAANGTFSITGLSAGTSGSLTCTKSGYSWASISVSSMNGNLSNQNFTNLWYAAGGTLASCKLAYKFIGAASQAGSYINLPNPGTNDLTLHAGTVTWASATGVDFSAFGRLTTGYTPPNQVTRSAFVRFSNASLGTLRGAFGMANGGVEFGFRNSHSTNKAVFNNGSGGAFLVAPDYTNGVLGFAGLTAYANGSSVGSIAAGTYDLGSVPLMLGDYGTTTQWFDGKEQAFILHDITLTPTQVSILTTAMANLV